MKKKYQAPVTNSVVIESAQLMAGSLGNGEKPIMNFGEAEVSTGGKSADARRFGLWDDGE